ncbi:hypothetical protein JIQ42_04182 [Leishmania sp. Namibia]|uniref:hypothetical protein n=1 Tax=Leishmania sp. Namibia TaxID=2802991 RepID=UPI001B5DEF9C|nr:hypothetical protein JIQ42_04182 [Leishmania sp. Namibia]
MKGVREEPRRRQVEVADDARGQQQPATSVSAYPLASPLLLQPNRELVWLGNCNDDRLPHSCSSRELDSRPLAESGEDDRDDRLSTWDRAGAFDIAVHTPTCHATADITTDRMERSNIRSISYSHRGDAPNEREKGSSGADTAETPAAGMTPPSSASFLSASLSCDLPHARGPSPALVMCGSDTTRHRSCKCLRHADPACADCDRCRGSVTSTTTPTTAPPTGHLCFPYAVCSEDRNTMFTSDTGGDRSLCLCPPRCRGSSSCSPREYWAMRPRLCGVNEVLVQSAAVSGEPLWLSQALAAFPPWDTPLLLELHDNSAGGTYMVRLARPSSSPAAAASMATVSGSSGAVVAVFKPCSEEIGQQSNPHANCESERSETFAPGSGSPREVLAYLLDHGHNAGVPPTLEVISTYSVKVGATTANDFESGAAAAAPDSPMCTQGAAAGGEVAPANGVLHGRCMGEKGWRGGGAAGDGVIAARAAATVPPQIGSLQLFIPDCKEAADVLPGHFDVDEVHALAIFDIRTLNGDRHGGNVLVRNYHRCRDGRRVSIARCPRRAGVANVTEGDRAALPSSAPATAVQSSPEMSAALSSAKDDAPHLIPIDHSYICPSGYADPDYEWLSWPQSKKPFSERNLAYIAALNAVEDAQLVRSALLAHSRAGSLDASTLQASTVHHDAEAVEGRPDAALTSLTNNDLQRAQIAVHESAAVCSRALVSAASSALAPRHTPKRDCGRCAAAASLRGFAVFSPLQTVSAKEVPATAGAVAAPLAPAASTWKTNSGVGAGDDAVCAVSHAKVWSTATAGTKFGAMDGLSVLERSRDTAALCAGAISSSWSLSSSSSSSNASFQVLHAQSRKHVPNSVTHDKDAANMAADVMRCTTRFLQIAALEFHMTAYEIGSLCRRPRVAQASLLEEVLEESKDELTWEPVWWRLDDVVRQRLARRRRAAL